LSFVSIGFLALLFVTVFVYYQIPHQYQWACLLVASYAFYLFSGPVYAIFLIASTVVTYGSGLLIGRINSGTGNPKYKKYIVALSLLFNIGILVVFKYADFFRKTYSDLLALFGVSVATEAVHLILPVGISFYTFQSLSYTIDVYRGDVEPEAHLGKYALFVSFFPTLISGPIQKSKDFLKKIDEVHPFDYIGVKKGVLRMLWGYFEKMVVADRLAILVNTVYENPAQYHGLESVLASLFYTFQIYCDFSGYSNIAIGAAEMMGFHLEENFNCPYFAKSIQEFWRRWHISLSTWFRDYLYFPLGGSRCSKLRRCLNVLIVFTVCGFWHGASLTFLFWGLLHGIYQDIGLLLEPLKERVREALRINKHSVGYRIAQIAITFLLVNFAWIFFRADTMENAFLLIGNMFRFDPAVLWNGALFQLGLTEPEFIAAILGVAIVLLVDILKKRIDLSAAFIRRNVVVRWAAYLAAVLILVLFGVYGSEYSAQNFIYFQF
jgi:alginate O-acetyltransferase complex protein AlgI